MTPVLVLLLVGVLACSVEAAGVTTFCNPVNVAYRFSQQTPSHREAADPTMVVHNNTFWLFASKSGGYWHSTDMNDWHLVVPTGLPIEIYAPMVVVIAERWYYTAFGAKAMYVTDDPYAGNWSKVTDMGAYSDPGMLVDDDGKVYMYHGCNSNTPISAVELDPATWKEVGQTVEALSPDMEHRGFEVGGDNNEVLDHNPFVEGAFMNKIGGKYYLQYAVPGTQYKSYADGLFIGDEPKGPFTFAPYSPFSSKPTGFAAGAGHGSTYQASAGGGRRSSSRNASAKANANASYYWHIATSTISVRAEFERRLGIYSTHLTSAGLTVDTYLGDYPQPLLQTMVSSSLLSSSPPSPRRIPKWMLLTLNKNASASSTLPSYTPGLALNEDIRTWWSAKTGKAGEWFSVDMGAAVKLHALQVNFADQDCSIIGKRVDPSDAYRYYVEYAGAGAGDTDVVWLPIRALDRRNNTLDRTHDYVELPSPLTVRQLRITNLHSPGGSKFSLSGLRAFGLGAGAPPRPATSVNVNRDPEDNRLAVVEWHAAEAAQFYIVRYGVEGMELFHNYQVFDATSATIHALVVGVQYAFVVDAVNENGVTVGKQVVVA